MMENNNNMIDSMQPKKLLACAKCYKLHRKCTGESRPCDYCRERKLECIENPERKKRGRPKGSKNKFKSTLFTKMDIQNIMELTQQRKRALNPNINNMTANINNNPSEQQQYNELPKRQKVLNEFPIHFNPPSIIMNTNNNIHQNEAIPIYHLQPQRMLFINQPQQTEVQSENNNSTFNLNDFPKSNTPNNIERKKPIMIEQEEIRPNIPISHHARHLIYQPETNSPTMAKGCIKCNKDMQTFKFCP